MSDRIAFSTTPSKNFEAAMWSSPIVVLQCLAVVGVSATTLGILTSRCLAGKVLLVTGLVTFFGLCCSCALAA